MSWENYFGSSFDRMWDLLFGAVEKNLDCKIKSSSRQIKKKNK